MKIIDKEYEYNYFKLNFVNINDLLKKGFELFEITDQGIFFNNSNIETLVRKTTNTLFIITVIIKPAEKKIVSQIYIDYTKKY